MRGKGESVVIPAAGNHRKRTVAGPHTKIKILHIIARLCVSGAVIHVVDLSAGFDPLRFESLLVAGRENIGEGSMLDYALSQGVQPIIIPEMAAEFSIKPRDLRGLIKLYRLILEQKPHIVNTHTAKAGCLGRIAAHMARVPVVIHTYHGHVLHGYYGRAKTNVLRRMERALGHLTDCIIAVDAQVKRDLLAYRVAPPEKIVVVPYGLHLEPLLTCEGQRGDFRRELRLSQGAKLVGIVGRIFPIKNHRLFLDAATLIVRQEPATRFVIVGDGILRPEMEHHAHRMGIAGQVIFTGWRQDLPRIYADLDLLAVTSNNEGTPFSAIEAMAAGCPVVATRVGGLPDLIHEGQTGYLVPPGDAPAVAEAMLRLLHAPETARCMGQAARARVKDCFTVRRLIRDTEQLYLELLGRASAHEKMSVRRSRTTSSTEE
jgi:glycosyltransferase involved in cell wall biosynthesis